MRTHRVPLRLLIAPAAIAALVSCSSGDEITAASHATMHGATTIPSTRASAAANAAAAGLVATVHSNSARYHSQTQATKNGYAVASPCVSAPGLGTMGFHWVNQSLVDPVFDPLNPEAVLYDTRGKLVAVEYIVINVGQPRPSFEGYPFDINGTPVPVPHWSLHVWAYRDNPSGIFTPFNPSFSC